MTWLRRLWRWIANQKEPVSRSSVASLDEIRSEAEQELAKQREGLVRESRQRRVVRAELDRMVVAATRDVLKKRLKGTD